MWFAISCSILICHTRILPTITPLNCTFEFGNSLHLFVFYGQLVCGMHLNRFQRWGIALTCCYINFLFFGIARSSCLFYLATLTQYNVDRSLASFPFILCFTVRNLSGPLIGYLGTKFQVQSVIICGTVLASIAVGSCYFAEDIYLVITLWGIVYAVGFGMATISIPEVLAQNFDEYLTNANGLAFSGECIGGSLLPPLLVIYLETYGLSGTFLILFGLTSTSIPAALLLNPKYHQKKTAIYQKSPALLQGREIFSEAFQVLSASHGVSNEIFNPDESSMSPETKKLSVAKVSHSRINISNTLQNAGSLSAYQETFKHSNKTYLKTNGIKSKSLDSIPTFVSAKTKHSFKAKVPAHTIKNIQIDTERKPHTSEQSSENKFRIRQDILNDPNTEIKGKRISSSFKTEESTISHSYSSYYTNKCRHWVFLRTESSDAHLIKEQNCSKQYGSLSREITEDSTSESKYSKPLIEPCKQTPSFRFEDKIQKNTPTPNIPSSPRNASFLEPFRVFFDEAFIFILVTQSLILYNSTMFLTIIVDFCKDCGLSSSQRVTVLVCTSVAETGGRVLLGWFTDLNCISNASFSAVCCFIMGIAFGSLVFVKELTLVCLLVAMLGLSLGGFCIVGPGVISDHLQEDKRPMALAARFFLYALLSLSQSPLIGYIRGGLGSYYWMFVILAVICLLASLTSLLTPFAAEYRDKRRANQKEEINENACHFERANLI